MKRIVLLLTICSSVLFANSQVLGFFLAKEYGKEFATYYSKQFLYRDILKSPQGISKFSIDAVSAANSGELTTLSYSLDDSSKKGLILGFFGNYISENGVSYLGYRYLNFSSSEALEFLNLIQSTVSKNERYLDEDPNKRNVALKYKDITIIISRNVQSYTMRLFWETFDSEWNWESFSRTRRKFSTFLNKED